MSFQSYFAKPKSMTQSALAAAVGCCKQQINHIVRGRRKPSGDLARRIIEATGGEVTYEDLYGKPDIQSPEQAPEAEERIGG